MSTPSPNDHAPRGGLAGPAANSTLKSITSPPMSFSDALDKAKATSETENGREGDTHRAHTTTMASQPQRRANRRMRGKGRQMSNCVCWVGCSTLGIMAAVGCMRRVHVLLVHSVLSLCLGTRPILPDPAHICMTRRVPKGYPLQSLALVP